MSRFSILLLAAVPLWGQSTLQSPATGLPSSTGPFEFKFREAFANGANHVDLIAPASIASDFKLELPSAPGTSGNCLKVGTLSGGVQPITTAFCDVLWDVWTAADSVISVRTATVARGIQVPYVRLSDYGTGADTDGVWKLRGTSTATDSTMSIIDSANVQVLKFNAVVGGVSTYQAEINSDLVPPTDDYGKVGTSGLRFNEGHFKDLYMDACFGAGCGSGGLPVVDTTAVVEGSSDATKLLRFEVDGFTTATTRVLTPQDANYIIAAQDFDNAFTSQQSSNTGFKAVNNTSSYGTAYVAGNKVEVHQGLTGNHFDFVHQTTNILRLNDPSGNPVMTWDADGAGVDNITYHGDLIPSGDNTWSIGVSGVEIKDIRMDGSIWAGATRFMNGSTLDVISGNIEPSVSGRVIGTALNPYGATYSTEVHATDLHPLGVGVMSLFGDFWPSADATYNMGDESGRNWAKVAAVLGKFTSHVTVGGNLTVTGTCTFSGGTPCGGGLFTDSGATTYLTSTGDNLCVGCTSTSYKMDVSGPGRFTGTITTAHHDFNSDNTYDIGQSSGARPRYVHVADSIFVYPSGSSTAGVTITYGGISVSNAGTSEAFMLNSGIIWARNGYWAGPTLTAGITYTTASGCVFTLGILTGSGGGTC